MSVERLREIYEILKDVPAGKFGEANFFNGDVPCCAIGHALDRTPGAKEIYWRSIDENNEGITSAALALGLDTEDVSALTWTNDNADGHVRKSEVLDHLKRMLG